MYQMRPFLFLRGTKTYARFTVPTSHQQAIRRKFLTFALGECSAPIARLRSCMLEIRLALEERPLCASSRLMALGLRLICWAMARAVASGFEAGEHQLNF
jgi:hypothetical protein